ncbi:MAG: DUF167 domain-containing protein [Candidatus Sumerlaeaceae bacterium]|nr:DUF167 domain-containing protein [Candidatus Sumerlaeaceae bacterium]
MGHSDSSKKDKRLIRIKVHPHAKRDHVAELEPDYYSIWTTAAPEKGKANEAVRRLLAERLGVAPSCLELRKGATSREKVFELTVFKTGER